MSSYTIGIIFAIILGITSVVLVLTKKTAVICETVECDGLTKTNYESLKEFVKLISVNSGSKPSVTFNSNINIGGGDDTSNYNLNVNNGSVEGKQIIVNGSADITNVSSTDPGLIFKDSGTVYWHASQSSTNDKNKTYKY